MSELRITRALAPGIFTLAAISATFALAQQPDALQEIVVTATRSPVSVSRSGSAVTVIDAAEIERSSARGLTDVLRSVPGLEISENGGVGSAAYAKLRGSGSGQTLILVDGVRAGDPTGVDGALDLGALAVTDIERIEVLRGPQSALYGSDAMGGVINIITRKGSAAPRRSASIEGGSYGTLHGRGAVSGSTDRTSYAFSIDALHTDGFARYVDRAQVRAGTWPAVPKSDPTNRIGVSGRLSYKLGDSAELEAGATGSFNRLRFDNPFAFNPANIYAPFNHSSQFTGSAFARASLDAFDGKWKSKLTLFETSVDRSVSYTESCPDFFSNCASGYRGKRYGAEYQGDVNLGRYGLLIFGARTETETAKTSIDLPAFYFGPAFNPINARQTTNSLFALQQATLGERLDVSFGGRIDAVSGGKTFATWRATAAYRLTESGTKLRASIGTGAKTPSLYQRFSEFGKAALAPERSTGIDVGVDQTLFAGHLNLSGSLFYNRYRDLIDFANVGCAPAQFFGCYYNVGRAVTYGAEVSADAVLVPDEWRARLSYTHLIAKNDVTNAALLQRARNKGSLSVIYTGIPNLELEGRATYSDAKLDFGFPAPVRLAPWGRFDAFATYKINSELSLFGRIENISNQRYEDILNYQVAGRSFYAGLKASW